MPKNYLALTIGPIYKTISQARQTRELWSASFSFSLLMKCLVGEFSKYGKLLSPSPDVKLPLHGAGVYPDRCYFELSKELTIDEINASRANTLNIFCSKTGYKINESNYFQIYVVQKFLDQFPIKQLNQILDGMELSGKYFNKKIFDLNWYWENNSAKFFQRLYDIGYGEDSLLPPIKVKYSNGDSVILKRFKSIPEIATTELEHKYPGKYWDALGIQYIKTANGQINFEQIEKDREDDQDTEEIISKLKGAFSNEFRFRHKYFTIIQADGDNVGNLLTEVEKNNGDVLEFSDALNDFVKNASEVIKGFGGFPIYMGGDDLLFFAPLTNETHEGLIVDFSSTIANSNNANQNIQRTLNGKNVFYLMTVLNHLIRAKLGPIVTKYNVRKPVSLSFGLSVGYFKKPMNEVLSGSYELLFHNAKNQACKNYIALNYEKHSGQSFSLGFNQNTMLYYHFLGLTNESRGKDENFLNSVMFKIYNQSALVANIAGNIDKLKCFFNENFNESNHAGFRKFFEEVIHIIFETFIWFSHESNDEKMNRIYSTLRFVHFLNAKDNHE